MHLGTIARTILFGETLEDKLVFDDSFTDDVRAPALAAAPRFPGRPPRLATIGRATFPSEGELATDEARGRLLHFFANHELLAMELMALMLLRFPDAPTDFRAGVAFTIRDEQRHMALYLARMRELGVEFGDLPVSDYFWNAMRDMTSPLQFVTQMGLTLEQANLDFSLYYQRAVARVGDDKTAAILERVYREEIAHVRHGVTWFNRLRPPDGSDDWDAYLRLLPLPMTPGRAKGLEFTADGRREAGLSDRFIAELEVYGGSKGRPAVFWIFNPLCETEIARATVGHTPTAPVARLTRDLETLPMFLARAEDVVLVEELPRAEWLKGLQRLGFAIPEFRRAGRIGEMPRDPKLAAMEPWGWSPEPFARFRPWRARLTRIEGAPTEFCERVLAHEDFATTGLPKLFAKTWSVEFFRAWLAAHPGASEDFGPLSAVGEVYRDWESARSAAAGGGFAAKAPYGTSGAQMKRVIHDHELDGTIGRWIQNTIERQGAVVIEPWLTKIADLSFQIDVRDDGVRAIGARQFENGPHNQYRGTILDPKLRGLSPEALRFLHGGAIVGWEALAIDVGSRLRAEGYRGNAGIDALLWRDDTGRIYLKPIVEINPRWTMGRLAIALEARVHQSARAEWRYVTVGTIDPTAFPPPTSRGGRIVDGVVFTTDPESAREVFTVLAVGDGLEQLNKANTST